MFKKRIFLLLIAIVLSGCSSAPKAPTVTVGKTIDMYQCARDHLNKNDQKIYDALLSGYLDLEKEIILQDIEISKLNELIKAIEMDHPELYYLDKSFEYEIDASYKSAAYLYYRPKYRFTKSEIKSRNQEIKQATAQVIKDADKLEDDYAKVKYVYDYLIDHIDYDEKSVENQNILSTFLHHKTVCAGYARGMQYLLNQLAIPCTTIPGFVIEDKGETSHAWNMVKMDGAYYYLDVTNGDQDFKTKELRYIYFGMTKDQILKFNRPYTTQYLEETPSRKDSYFSRNNAYFTSADTKQLHQLIKKSSAMGYRIVYQCADETIAKSIDRLLVNQNLIFDLTGFDYYDSYTFDETYTYAFIPNHQKL